MFSAIWAFFSEVFKALGANDIEKAIEPWLVATFGTRGGQFVATIIATTIILAASSIVGLFATRAALRWWKFVPIVIGASLRKKKRRHFLIGIADLEGDSRGGKKKLIIAELQRALRFAHPTTTSAELQYSIDLLNLPRTLALPDLEELGQLSVASSKSHKRLRRWLRTTGCDVIIWGEYIRGEGGEDGTTVLNYVCRDMPVVRSNLYSTPFPRILDSTSTGLRRDLLISLLMGIMGQLTNFSDPMSRVGYSALVRPFIERLTVLIDSPPAALHYVEYAQLLEYYAHAAYLVGLGSTGTVWLDRAVSARRRLIALGKKHDSEYMLISSHSRIGATLMVIGYRTGSDEVLLEAIKEHERALEDGHAYPLLAGYDHFGIGQCQLLLSDNRRDFGHADKAVSALRSAEICWRADDQAKDRAKASSLLSRALKNCFQFGGNTRHLEEAKLAAESALAALCEKTDGDDWVDALEAMADLGRTLGLLKRDESLLFGSAEMFRKAAEKNGKDLDIERWARSQNDLALSVSMIAELMRDVSLTKQGIALYWDVIRSLPFPPNESIYLNAAFGAAVGAENVANIESDEESYSSALGLYPVVLETGERLGRDYMVQIARGGIARCERAKELLNERTTQKR